MTHNRRPAPVMRAEPPVLTMSWGGGAVRPLAFLSPPRRAPEPRHEASQGPRACGHHPGPSKTCAAHSAVADITGLSRHRPLRDLRLDYTGTLRYDPRLQPTQTSEVSQAYDCLWTSGVSQLKRSCGLRCGDPRWAQPSTRWNRAVVGKSPSFASVTCRAA